MATGTVPQPIEGLEKPIAQMNIQVIRGGRTGNRYTISGPDMEMLHRFFEQHSAAPGPIQNGAFEISTSQNTELNLPVDQALIDINKRAIEAYKKDGASSVRKL